MWKNSLKLKLVISFSLITLVAIVISGTSTLVGVRRTIEQEIQNELLLLADAKEGQVFAYLDSLESRTLDFSSDGLIRDSMKEIVNGLPQAVTALNEHLLKNKKTLDPDLVDIDVLDKNGAVVASTNPQEIGRDKKGDACFLEGKKGIATINAEKDEYPNISTAVLEVAAPLINENTDEFLGVIVNIFDTGKLDSILSGEFQIQKGALLAREGFAQTLAMHLVDKEKKVLAHGHKETGHKVDTIDTLPVQQCLNSKEEIVGTYMNHLGVEVTGASVCFPQRGWTLLTEINTQEAFASVRDTTYGLVIMLTLLFFMMILEIFLIAGRIIYPIKQLHEATNVIAGGNLDYTVDIKTGDEIEQLAVAFNTMAFNLKKSYSELLQFSKGLEEKVTEKTKELTGKVASLEEARSAMTNVMEDFEEEKNKMTAILINMGDGMIATDENRRIIYMSRSAEEMLGWGAKDAIGKHISDWLVIEDKKGSSIPDEQKPTHLVLSSGKKIPTTIYYFVPKGREKFPAAVTAAPIFSGETIIGVIVIFRDVTHDVEVDKAKTEFVSLASHQLRTPLSAMKWFGEMLLKGDAGALNSGQKEMVENIYASNERMVELVNSLLNISRIESGRLIIDPKPTDAGALVKDVVRELKMNFDEKQQTCIVSVHENLPLVPLDPKLIRQVYMNLLTNANKYTAKGGEIQVYLSKNATDLISQVTDNGYGIPKVDQGRVFQKFFRAQNILQMETEGTGLGLYLIKSIIESSGGKIWFESEKDKGTTFWFSIPLSGMIPKKGDVGLEEKMITGAPDTNKVVV
jgi:PAS domain S-box-containing protein